MNKLFACVLAFFAVVTAAHAQTVGGAPASTQIVSGGTGLVNQPFAVQPNANIISPYDAPYLVIPDGPGVTPGATTQTGAVRNQNRLSLNQWWTDVGQTYPGGIQALADYSIEVCNQPSLPTVTNQSQGSLDFRNTSALAGSETLSVRNGAQFWAYDCNNPTAPVQAPIIRLGGRAQRVTLTVSSFVSPTTDPVVSHAATVTFNGSGQMTVTGTLLNNGGGSIAQNAKGSIQTGQYIVRSPGTSSTIPVGCYVTGYVSGGTSSLGGGAIYTVTGGPVGSPTACATYNNAVGQTVYFGQAAEVANNAEDGNIGFALSCPVDSEYDLYATKVATGRTIEPYAAGTAGYGSCGSGNTSYNNNWRRWRASTPISYRPSDMQSWNAGGSGDQFVQQYMGNGGGDLNMCSVQNKYFAVGQEINCESGNVGAVESADYLNINTASNGGQTNIIPIADWYQVGGNTNDKVGVFHFESNSYNCTANSWNGDNVAFVYQGSGTSVSDDIIQTPSTTLANCNHFAYHRMFGTDVHVTDGIVQDPGTATGSGHWTLGGAAVAWATSNNSNITLGTAYAGAVNTIPANTPNAITAQTYNLPTADSPVVRYYGGNVVNNSAPITITDVTQAEPGINLNPASVTGSNTSSTGIGLNITGTLNTSAAVTGTVLNAAITNTACTGCNLISIKAGAGGATTEMSLSMAGTLTLGLGVTMGGASVLQWNGDGALYSGAANDVAIGGADIAAPVAQTIHAYNVLTGTSNTNGANTVIAGGKGTGTGTGGSILFSVAPAGGSGTTQNALSTALTIDQTFHHITGGSAPTCGAGCSTVTGTDTAMTITAGTTVTSVAVNFNKTWASAPRCVVSDNSTATTMDIASISTTVLTLNTAAAISGTTIYAICMQ